MNSVKYLKKLMFNKQIQVVFLSILGIIFISIFIWIALITKHVLQLRQDLFLLYDIVQKEQLTSAGDAKTVLEDAYGNLYEIKKSIKPLFPVFNFVSIFPGIGNYFGQIQPWLDLTIPIAKAGILVMKIAEPVWQGSADNDRTNLQKIIFSVETHSNDIESIIAELKDANEARKKIKPELLPKEYQLYYTYLDNNYDLISNVFELLDESPNFTGAYDVKTYLLIAQNNDELRATGGFISAIGTLEIRQGKITYFDIADSYKVDDYSKAFPKAPEPLEKYMLASYWVTRDGNWSPDFPTAARQIELLYRISQDRPIDGVVCIDQTGIRYLVGALGTLTLPDYPENITADNVVSYMQFSWNPKPPEGVTEEWWLRRKNFIKILGDVLIKKAILTDSPELAVQMILGASRAMKEGHLLIYMNETKIQEVISKTEWDGGVKPVEGQDFLMLVDSNIGFNKVDAVILRTLDYFLDFSEITQPKASIRVHYTNPVQIFENCIHQPVYGDTYLDMEKRCYWDYWRILVNGASTFDNAQLSTVSGDWLLNGQDWNGEVISQPGENGTLSIEGLMVLPTGLDQEIIINIKLPEYVIKNTGKNINYNLDVQKQLGLNSLPFTIYFRLPEGFTIIGNKEALYDQKTNLWIWKKELVNSRYQFKFEFHK
jgi:hypothetical protein